MRTSTAGVRHRLRIAIGRTQDRAPATLPDALALSSLAAPRPAG
jgi:hypothetical protein